MIFVLASPLLTVLFSNAFSLWLPTRCQIMMATSKCLVVYLNDTVWYIYAYINPGGGYNEIQLCLKGIEKECAIQTEMVSLLRGGWPQPIWLLCP